MKSGSTTTSPARVARFQEAHRTKHPDGCGATWLTMCEHCCARIGATFRPHPEVVAWRRLHTVTRYLISKERESLAVLDRFAKRFAGNPADAFEWADTPMEAAAHVEVARTMGEVLKEKTLEVALAYAEMKAKTAARFPSRSSSQAANVMWSYRCAAWAEVSETLSGLVKAE